jgi:Na+/proline symporter
MFLADFSWLGLETLDWVVLGAYFVLMLAIGLWSMRKVRDMPDYFMGGRRFGKIFMMFFAFGSGTRSDPADSVVAGSWRVGLAGIWWQLLWLWVTPFYWLIAPVLRRMRALSTADFFQARFGSGTAFLYSIFGILLSIVFLAGALFGSGKMVDELTGHEIDRVAQAWNVQIAVPKWNEADREIQIEHRRVQGYEYALLAMTVLFVAYVMAGGLRAGILTGLVQGLLMLAFSFLLLPYVFGMIGGFGELHSADAVKPGLLDFVLSGEGAANIANTLSVEPMTGFYVVMLSVLLLLGIGVQPHIMAVCGAGKTETASRVGLTFGSFLRWFCVLGWTFTGLALLVWYLGSDSPLSHADAPQPGTAEYQALSEPERNRIEEDRRIYPLLKARASEDFQNLSAKEQADLNGIDQDFAERLFGRAAYDILPNIAPGLIGLFLAGLLATIMSAADVQMVVASGLFTNNLYKKYLAKHKSQRHYVWVGRFSGLLIVLLAIVLQTTFDSLSEAFESGLDTSAILGLSLWFGIVWRGWTPAAVWVSTICGVLAWAACLFFPHQLREWGLSETLFHSDGGMLHLWRIVFSLSAGVLSGFVTSLVTKRVREDKLDAFFRLIHTPVKPGEVIAAPCTLPDDALPAREKLFNIKDLEISKPTWIGVGGFIAAWISVGLIVWLTSLLARIL